jgi:hypothetical protein
MSSIMDGTPGTIALSCASCHQERPIACCYCDAELCEACTPIHLTLCFYAKARLFRTWKPEKKDLT